MNELSNQDLQLSTAAVEKMIELVGQVEENIEGIRVFAQPGGCSGMQFGMTFSDEVHATDFVRENQGVKLIVGAETIDHLRGADIDYMDRGDGQPSFVFNNLPAPTGGGCGTCGSQSGCGS